MKPTTEINTTIDYRKIGVHLKEARKANSLSQAQVAASLRISVCAYGNLERGSQRINLTRSCSFANCWVLLPEAFWQTVRQGLYP